MQPQHCVHSCKNSNAPLSKHNPNICKTSRVKTAYAPKPLSNLTCINTWITSHRSNKYRKTVKRCQHSVSYICHPMTYKKALHIQKKLHKQCQYPVPSIFVYSVYHVLLWSARLSWTTSHVQTPNHLWVSYYLQHISISYAHTSSLTNTTKLARYKKEARCPPPMPSPTTKHIHNKP